MESLNSVPQEGKQVTAAAYDKVIRAFNRTHAAFPQEKLLHELFEEQVKRIPTEIALVFEGQTLSYGKLNTKANQLARFLIDQGVGPDHLVGLCVERSPEMVIGLIGILKAGAAYVPLDPGYPVERLSYMLSDAAPTVLLTQSSLRQQVSFFNSTVVCLDTEWTRIARYAGHDLHAKDIGLNSRHLAYVIYTSGSTGQPKGAMNEHRAVVNRLCWMQTAYALVPTDRVLQKTPFSFDVSVWEFFWTLLYGAKLVVARPDGHRDPDYLREVIEAEGVTRLHFVPSMLQSFLSEHPFERCPTLKHIICSGEELSAALQKRCFERLPQVRLSNLYGPTEAAVDVTAWECSPEDTNSRVPIGRPISNVQIYVLDANRRPVDIGEQGEIYIAGVGVGRGYLRRPDLTAERFVADPFSGDAEARMYKTGDLGRWRPDGALEYLGRNDNQIKLRGFRIELGEIEAQLLGHPRISQAAVLARDDVRGDKRLVAYLALSALHPSQGSGESEQAGIEIVNRWRRLYEETYSEGDLAPNFVGWKSSYTGEPIAEEQMQEWQTGAVRRIRALNPNRVLEIGCGTGLILAPIAPTCETYHATDLSDAAIDRLRRWIAIRTDLQHVQVERRAALDVQLDRAGAYDTVILNSVVQYFPNIQYLRELLRRAVQWVSPGGHIFIGDVRHLGLLRAFHSSVQLARAAPETTVDQLRARITRALDLEKELVVDPRFFAQLSREFSEISDVRILVKRGTSDNELTRYRYDVVLRVGHLPRSPAEEWTDLVIKKHATSELFALLESRRPRAIRLRVLNGRVAHDMAAARLIEQCDAATSVATLRHRLSTQSMDAVDPEILWKLGEQQGYEVTVSPDPNPDKLEVKLLDRAEGVNSSAQAAAAVRADSKPRQPAEFLYANNPLASSTRAQFLAELRNYLLQRLPSHMIPSAFVFLDSLPLSPNGKLDRRALPPPQLGAYVSSEYQAPRGPLECQLASMWEELLRVERIGRDDNFFELGGHSLLIVQMMDRLRRGGWCVDLRDIYTRPTIARLTNALREATAPILAVPSYEIPPDCDEITPQMLPLLDLNRTQIARIVATVPGGVGNIQDIYPLAPLQEGILFHHLLKETGEDPYIVPTLLQISSQNDLEGVIAALQQVIDRHDALRTAIVWEGLPKPVQVVYRSVELPVETITLDPRRPPIEQLRERIRPESQHFDLRRAPLVRLQVAREPATGHCYALLQLHHVSCDYESLATMLAEIVTCLTGKAAELTVPAQYRDHVAQTIARGRGRNVHEFFKCKLKGIDEPTAPFGLLDVQGNDDRVAEAQQTVDDPLAGDLRGLSRLLNVSAATLFHAAWALVLAHTTGRDDVVFGTVLIGRMHGEAAAHRAVGMFINTLPLRLRLEGLNANALVEHARDELIELLDHEEASLADAQRCSGVGTGIPLFGSIFNYRHNSAVASVLTLGTPGLKILETRSWTNYPIVVSVDDSGDGFSVSIQTRGVDPYRILAYLTRALEFFAQALATGSTAPVLNASVLPQSEESWILSQFGAPRIIYPQDKLIHELFASQVQQRPHATAVVYGGQNLTYAELDNQANALALYLVGKGVGPDVLVGVYVERCVEMVVALLGILKAGGAYLPLDPAYPPDRLAYVLRDAAPPVLLTQESLKESLPHTSAEIVTLDGDWSAIASAQNQESAPGSAGGNVAQTRPHNLAYVIYTSGSTGRPKGVMVEHRNVTRLFAATQKWFSFNENDVWTLFHSFAFDFSVWELWGALLHGGRVIIVPSTIARSPADFYLLLCDHGVTVLNQTPSAFARLVAAQTADQPRHSLRVIIFGGEALELHTLVPWVSKHGALQPQLINMYGITETTVHVTYCPLSEQQIHSAGTSPVGCPIDDLYLYLLDRHHRPVPVGVIGEIYVGGAGVARGYLNQHDLTRERFIRNPFSTDPEARLYKSGDLGRWRADGALDYLGRNDHQVKIRGFRIELGEIEAQLLRHPRINEAVVITREDVSGEKSLVAYFVANCRLGVEPPPATDELRAHLKTVLPEYMIPGAFVPIAQLPLTENGKLDRRALPAPSISAYAVQQYEAPQGEIEEGLARIWRDLLRIERVGRRDSFFELGGHSVSAMQAIVRIRSVMSLELPVSVLFEHPTLMDLAQHIEVVRNTRLLRRGPNAGDNIDSLLEAITSMPEREVEALIQRLRPGERL